MVMTSSFCIKFTCRKKLSVLISPWVHCDVKILEGVVNGKNEPLRGRETSIFLCKTKTF